MFRPVPNGTGSRSRASRRNRTQGHRLGGGSVRESGQPYQNRGHTTAYVPHVPRRYAHLGFFSEDDDDDLGNYSGQGYNDPMHALASAMANLDTIHGGGRRDHQSSRGDSRGLWFPFASSPGGDECLDRIMDIGELHIGAFQEVFSSLFFTGRLVNNQPGDVLADFFPVGRASDDGFHNRGVGRGDHLPFHVHATPQRRDMNNQATPRREDMHNQASGTYVYVPVEFEPNPVEEAIEPTRTGE